MQSFVAVYDACVLYPAALRDLLLRLALTGLFRARWTERIHVEWMSALARTRPDIPPSSLEWTRRQMDAAVPDCLVTGYEGLESDLVLPDPRDAHVLAAAIRCGAGCIVTFNLKDFPAAALARHGIAAQHPDEFVEHLIDLDPLAVCAAVREQRAALRHPALDIEQLFAAFLRQGLAATVAALREHTAAL